MVGGYSIIEIAILHVGQLLQVVGPVDVALSLQKPTVGRYVRIFKSSCWSASLALWPDRYSSFPLETYSR
jgi:hypothetical protein